MRDMLKAVIAGYLLVKSQEDTARRVFQQQMSQNNETSLSNSVKRAREKALKIE